MMPVVAFNLLHALEITANAVDAFVRFCVDGITANEPRCRAYAERSMSIVTALNPHIGCARAAEVAEEYLASGKSIHQFVLEEGLLPEQKLDDIFNLRAMTEHGIYK